MWSIWTRISVGSFLIVAVVLVTVCAVPDGLNAAQARRAARAKSSGQTDSGSDKTSRQSASSRASCRSISIGRNGRTVSITESSDSGITVTMTEEVDGKEKKTVVKAADAKELKKKNEEAYRLYERHFGKSKNGSDIRQKLGKRPSGRRSPGKAGSSSSNNSKGRSVSITESSGAGITRPGNAGSTASATGSQNRRDKTDIT